MGMAASQARLLSITARLTDNEQTGQALSYTKQRLADETEQINAEYLEALESTKLTVLTGFNGSIPNYTDISYNLMTGYNTVACGRQYVVANAKGQILVTKAQKDAFELGNGDFNKFLEKLGYSQADFAPSATAEEKEQQVHDAWDKYFNSVGIDFYDTEHDHENPDMGFGYYHGTVGNSEYEYASAVLTTGTVNGKTVYLHSRYSEDQNGVKNYYYYDDNGDEVSYNGKVDNKDYPLNFVGISNEQRELYDYAVALTKAYCGDLGASIKTPTDDPENANYIAYLRNIFNQMALFGYYTENDESTTIKDNNWFEQQLREGKLYLKYFSATENTFIQTTISEDDTIQEVEDDRKIALAETKYTQDTAAIEKKDQKIDLELKKLDSEHSALKTEYDSVQTVLKKNVEKSFNMFS